MSQRKNRVGIFDRAIALFAALLVFGGFAFFLWTNVQNPEKREVVQAFDAKEIATIAASTVTEDQIKKQKEKILKKEQEKKQQEKLRREQEKKKLDDIKKKQQQEKKKLEDLKRKQAEEKKAIALRKKKAEEEAKKRKLEKERKEKERKAKEAAEKKAREKAAAEKKKRDEAREKQLAEEAAKKARQDALAAELDAERQRALAEQSARASTTLMNRYSSLIQKKIQGNFITPIGVRVTREPLVNIQLDDSGNLISARIVTSSGDVAYDQAALSAVGKSSPLPLPKDDERVKKRLQDFNLRVTPF